jgi:hypothetical protein
MVHYSDEVRKEAVDFIDEMFDEFIEALKNEEDYFFSDSSVDDRFFECVGDRSYTLTDAAFVIENSDNVETDSGLWEGQDPVDAVCSQAAYTFSNDVRFEVEEIYEDVKSEYDRAYSDVYDELADKHSDDVDYDPTEDAMESAAMQAKEYFQNDYHEDTTVVTGVPDRIRMIERYLALGNNASTWDGYPCGSSYIDSRCGVGFGMPEIHDYVEYDHMIAKAIPEIDGKSKSEVKKYLEELRKSNH